ncbi:MAG: glycosyl hydrolase, partial [Bacteroidales bacterium]|nr:glycosyl hydrolase [Bacteroidales bacterium]
LRPGMTMGPYGVHWDRGQTWWTMSGAYHTYIARAQYLLQRGRTVADVLYLAPESTPHVFRAPDSAYDKAGTFMPDRKGYSFDGCPPSMLSLATVKDGRIIFPSGASYRLLVLPDYPTATPAFIKEIIRLKKEGATIIGKPFRNSPSLSGYPACDDEVARLSGELFADGSVITYDSPSDNLYPSYELTASILSKITPPDFVSDAGTIRFTHRTLPSAEIYFVSNRADQVVSTTGSFRVTGRTPELWDPMTGQREAIATYSDDGTVTKVKMRFDPLEGYFIIFPKESSADLSPATDRNGTVTAASIRGPWSVKFAPEWGGPSEPVTFQVLRDWTTCPDPGIKYYSGTAVYDVDFDMDGLDPDKRYKISLGEVKVMARVILNGKDLGIVWTSPWNIDAGNALVNGKNHLKVEVANLWQNRLVGDESLPKEGRYTYTTWHHYNADDPILTSGLIGPVSVITNE